MTPDPDLVAFAQEYFANAGLQPERWQLDLYEALASGRELILLPPRRSNRAFFWRCTIEYALRFATDLEIIGDDLHATWPDGTFTVYVGGGTMLDHDLALEAARIRRVYPSDGSG